jgi:hypothetical protein
MKPRRHAGNPLADRDARGILGTSENANGPGCNRSRPLDSGPRRDVNTLERSSTALVGRTAFGNQHTTSNASHKAGPIFVRAVRANRPARDGSRRLPRVRACGTKNSDPTAPRKRLPGRGPFRIARVNSWQNP